jgi:hypothetical protein
MPHLLAHLWHDRLVDARYNKQGERSERWDTIALCLVRGLVGGVASDQTSRRHVRKTPIALIRPGQDRRDGPNPGPRPGRRSTPISRRPAATLALCSSSWRRLSLCPVVFTIGRQKPTKCGSKSGDMCRDGTPCFILIDPNIRITPTAFASVRERIARVGMDDCHLAKNTDFNILGGEVGDCDGLRGLREKPLAVHNRSVRIAAAEVCIKDLVKTLDVGELHRPDIVLIESSEESRSLSRSSVLPFEISSGGRT